MLPRVEALQRGPAMNADEMKHPLRHWLTRLGVLVSTPVAFLMVPLYGLAWIAFYRETFTWASVATLATWFMTLLIQRAAYRDTQAIHAKLDELLHAQHEASNELTHIDKRDPEEIEQHRQEARLNDLPPAPALGPSAPTCPQSPQRPPARTA